MEKKFRGKIEETSCEVALIDSGDVCTYEVIRPQKGDYFVTKSPIGIMGRYETHVYFCDGEQRIMEMTERLTRRSLSLLSAKTAKRLVSAFLAGTWDLEIRAIEEETRQEKLQNLEREIESRKKEVETSYKEKESLRNEKNRLLNIIDKAYNINENGGPGSRKKLHDLIIQDVAFCEQCGITRYSCTC